MKALILNSGLGTRMGQLTSDQPKCMTEVSNRETILSRQLRLIKEANIKDVVITTGYKSDVLRAYCNSLNTKLNITYVKNEDYETTNYIYSIYKAKEYLINHDILLIHGDIVFENSVLDEMLSCSKSCMKVSSTIPLPEKDFKAQIDYDKITKIGINVFDNAKEAQPLYKINKKDWNIWLQEIINFCEKDNTKCYAEEAFNNVSDKCNIYPLDAKDKLCREIDTPEDLKTVTSQLHEIENRKVYMSFSTDTLNSAHINLINKAKKLGKVIIGIMSDEAIAKFKRYPMIPYNERKALFENLNGVYKVVEQKELSYANNLKKIKPDYVVHGDDWQNGFQKPIRDEVVKILSEYGGDLIEFPYADNEIYDKLEKEFAAKLSMPDIRRGRLKKLIGVKGLITAIEAHSGITGLIAEKTRVIEDGKTYQFDAMWVSSLCDSTAKGKPDIELVDMSSRFRTIDDIMEVTTKPIIFDGDTGGLTEHFVYTVRSLERMGVSMIIIEDKTGLKKNSLFGNEVAQTQDSIENFCQKIQAGKTAQKTKDFMICARIESLILEQGMEDALTRAFSYVDAGADAIVIHSRKKDPSEIKEFISEFRKQDKGTPIVIVPTSFNTVYEEEWKKIGANIVIYANQLTRTGFPAMQNAAETILRNRRAKECDDKCMSIKEIITLIPEE